MQTDKKKEHSGTTEKLKNKVLELTVVNHPGVMSHICGLFTRRAFNMEGILCMPVGDGLTSRIWIRTDGNGQLDQIIKQLRKLEDVRTVGFHSVGHQEFEQLERFFTVP